MKLLQKCSLLALATTALTLGFAPRAFAGWGWAPPSGGLVYLPDLTVTKVGKSLIGPNYIRVHVSNYGKGPSAPCWVRGIVYGSTVTAGYFPCPAVAVGSTVGMDVWVGSSPVAKPGMLTRVDVDVYGQVTETNESNNYGYFVAPAG